MLLQDQKSSEELCVKKYTEAANKANDPQLKQLFNDIGSHEQQHLNTVNQMLSGQVPTMNQAQQAQQSNNMQANMQSSVQGNYNENDATLCNDLLMSEKYISSVYNTSIFEFTNTGMRQALNHIQKEEQEHGEKLFNYMSSHGMYNPQ
ncbi:spore coat protein [Lutibacter sp. B2]|nr:spore coat protein [Lutibacter sp. B2]